MNRVKSIRWSLFESAACGAIALVLAVPGHARAADNDMGTVVVSANRTATPVDQVGSSVTVITAEEIEKSQALSASDVLRDIPGVSQFSYGGRGQGGGFSMRGLGSGYVLILIDGVKVTDPSMSMAFTLDDIQADNIERIEVLRGNQSTLYGSEAIGGVISVTTKNGRNATEPVAGGVSVEYGAYNTGKASGNLRGRGDNVYYSGNVNGLSTGGWDISTFDGGDRDGFKNVSGDATVGADVLEDVGILDRLNVETSMRYSKSRYDYDGWDNAATRTYDTDAERRKVQYSNRVGVKADLLDGAFTNAVEAQRSATRSDYYLNDARTTTRFDGEITRYEYQGTAKPWEDNTFVFGTEHSRDHADSSSYGSRAITNNGYFLNHVLSLLDESLTLSNGVRLDDHETFGDHTSYRSTVAYHLKATDTRFHASYGTGFLAPTTTQLYSGTAANPDLKPEESRGYDIGVDQSLLNKRVKVGSTFFRTDVSDKIMSVLMPGDSVKHYYNVSSFRVFGLENTASVVIDDEWSVSANYTWQQARDNSTGTVPQITPRNVAGVRLDYEPRSVEGLGLWVKAHAQSWAYDSAQATYLDGFVTCDFGASYEIGDDLTVYGRVENIADKSYQSKGAYPESGRAAYVGMRLKF